MLNINPTIKLVIFVSLVAIAGGLNAVAHVEPQWKWIGGVVNVVLLLEAFFTVPTSVAAKLKAAAVKTAASMLRLFAVLFVVALFVGCKAVQVAAPSSVATVACVVDDAIAGKGISQIVLDCGGDAAQVIAILADPANYPKTKGTPAYAEAGRAKLALAMTVCQ